MSFVLSSTVQPYSNLLTVLKWNVSKKIFLWKRPSLLPDAHGILVSFQATSFEAFDQIVAIHWRLHLGKKIWKLISIFYLFSFCWRYHSLCQKSLFQKLVYQKSLCQKSQSWSKYKWLITLSKLPVALSTYDLKNFRACRGASEVLGF